MDDQRTPWLLPGCAPIGLGSGAFTGQYGPVEDHEVISTVRYGLDLGIGLVDLADFYGAGRVERLVGKAIAGRRDEAVIATRGGLRFDRRGVPIQIDGSPRHLARACDDSLRRLGVERIDLYFLARIDPAVPVEESVGGIADLVEAGKVGAVGLADASAEQVRRAHAVHPLGAVAGEYSMLDRRAEREGLRAARSLGIGFLACHPLARGLLGGAFPVEGGPAEERLATLASTRGLRSRLLVAQRIAARHDHSLPRLALAWLLGEPGVLPVPSTRSRVHLELNAAAARVHLSDEVRRELAALFSPEDGASDAR
jgi:aryl-alcohol dehydrogenase-like predicted oxidoreductase